MELKFIQMDKVFADENNPRTSFDGLEKLAASFDANAERPGEPFIPPIVVKDGGIYRIVDGERRYRALKLRKAKGFHANVAETMDEANTLAAMLATDDKQPLTDAERSQGVQQMLLLGVDPVVVDKAARLDKGDAARVKVGMDITGDAVKAEEMSLDWLLAVNDVANSEGHKRAEYIAKADATSWPQRYADVLRKRENAEKVAGFRDVLRKMDVPEITERASVQEWRWENTANTPAALTKQLNALPDAADAVVLIDAEGYRCTATIFVRRDKVDEAANREAQQRADEWCEHSSDVTRNLFEWMQAQRAAGVELKRLDFLAKNALMEELEPQVDLYEEYSDSQHTGSTDPFTSAGLVMAYEHPTTLARHLDNDSLPEWVANDIKAWLVFIDCAQADGYELQDFEREMVETATKLVERGDAK